MGTTIAIVLLSISVLLLAWRLITLSSIISKIIKETVATKENAMGAIDGVTENISSIAKLEQRIDNLLYHEKDIYSVYVITKEGDLILHIGLMGTIYWKSFIPRNEGNSRNLPLDKLNGSIAKYSDMKKEAPFQFINDGHIYRVGIIKDIEAIR